MIRGDSGFSMKTRIFLNRNFFMLNYYRLYNDMLRANSLPLKKQTPNVTQLISSQAARVLTKPEV